MNISDENNLNNLSSKFEQYEAPFSADEMNADWQQVANKIGAGGASASGAGNGASGFFGSTVAKIIGGLFVMGAIVGIASLANEKENQIENGADDVKEVAITLLEEPTKANNNDKKTSSLDVSEPASMVNTRNAVVAQLNNEEPVAKTKKPSTPVITEKEATDEKEVSDKEPTDKKTNSKPARLKAAAKVSTFEMCEGNGLRIKLSNAHNEKLYFYRMVNKDNGRVETGSLQSNELVTLKIAGMYHLVVREMGDNSDRVLLEEDIDVFPKPKAKMSFTKDDCGNYTFIDNSNRASDAVWYMPGKTLAGKDVSHSFTKDGYQKVSLVVSNGRCSDTLTKEMLVEKSTANLPSFDIPNIFTPNGDGNNDVFDIAFRNPDIYQVNGVFEIYDAKNDLVFKSNSGLEDKWNGKMMNVGRDCESGYYSYIIRYTSPCNPNKLEVVSGLISIVR